MWVPSKECRLSPACYVHKTFDSSKSSTYKKEGTKFNITYGSGAVSGFVGQDTVTLAGLQAKEDRFGQVTELHGVSFLASKFDGILGMAWEKISVLKEPPVLDLLVKQGQVEHNSFSFYLTKKAGQDGSALVLGGVNPKYYTGEFKYYPLSLELYWGLAMDDVIFNGTSYKTGKLLGIVDSGTSVIIGPSKVVEKMTAAFGKGRQKQVDCSTVPSLPHLDFVIGGDKWTLEGKDYVLEVDQGGKAVCIVGILGLDLPPQLGEAFILGDSFMKAYYTHFDHDGERVGFARAA